MKHTSCIPLSTLFASAAHNLKLVLESLRNVGPSLRPKRCHKFHNCIVFLTHANKFLILILNLLLAAKVCVKPTSFFSICFWVVCLLAPHPLLSHTRPLTPHRRLALQTQFQLRHLHWKLSDLYQVSKKISETKEAKYFLVAFLMVIFLQSFQPRLAPVVWALEWFF